MKTPTIVLLSAFCGAITATAVCLLVIRQKQQSQEDMVTSVMLGKVAIAIQAAAALKANDQATLADFTNYIIDDGESAASRMPNNGYSDSLADLIAHLPSGVRAKSTRFPQTSSGSK
jgi:hypothetical protein